MSDSTADREPARLVYSPAIDGLRAIAVGAVVAYHLDKSWAAGGFLGVEVFLVISGFLITALMLAEHERTSSIDLRNFWIRRARRLLPALFAAIAAVIAYMAIVLPDELINIRGDVIAALLYVTNWFLSFSDQSYFDALGRPSPLRHLWSLAVEEQWYLIWPVVFLGLLKIFRGRIGLVATSIAAGAAASTLLMIVLYDPNVDPSRIYYGTDTRASGLLLGSLLALVWSPWKRKSRLSNAGHIALDSAALAGLLGLIVVFWKLHEFSPFLYRGGFLLVGVLTCLVIAGVVHPAGSLISDLLAWRPFVWLGTRSYGLYLWHWPIIAVTRPQLDIALDGWQLDLLQVGLSIALAEVSFRLVERPIRSGAIGRLWTRVRDVNVPAVGLRWATGLGSVALISTLVMLGVALADADAAEEVQATTADVADLIAATTPTSASTAPPSTTGPPSTASSTIPDTSSTGLTTSPIPTSLTTTTVAPTTTTTTEPRLPRRIDVTGDSVAITMHLNFPSDLRSTFVVEDSAIEGCGVIEEGSMLSGGRARRNFASCAGFADRWAASALRHEAEVVVVVLGAWEVFDIRLDGENIEFASEEHDTIIATGISRGVDALVNAGVQVALLEVPCFTPVDGGGLKALPERGDVTRTEHLTELLREKAASSTSVHLIVPPSEFCTDPEVASDLSLRWDGVHYGPRGGAFLWARIQDQLLAIPVDYGLAATGQS